MSQQDLLKRVATALESSCIPYLVSGSIASSIYGEPRLTHDIDFVIEVTPAAVDPLIRALTLEGCYLDEAAVREAVVSREMFNLIDLEEGDKVDFWLLTGDAFDRARFERRTRVTVFDVNLQVCTPEDIILMKLKWARASGGSRKQIEDVRGVYEMQKDQLDMVYIDSWIVRMQLEELWNEIRMDDPE